MHPALKSNGTDTFLSCHLQPRAKRSAITGLFGSMLKLAIDAPPVDGKANAALIKFISGIFQVSTSQISVISGMTSRNKVVKISAFPINVAEARLNAQIKE